MTTAALPDAVRPAHHCPGVRPDLAAQFTCALDAEPWLVRVLDVVAASGLSDAWIGAGVLRDVIWGRHYGSPGSGFDPAGVRDIDVAFFDPADLSRERDAAAQRVLSGLADLPWEATNQAAVHTWFHEVFDGPPVPAFGSVHDAVATWPETATCVAVRRGAGGSLEVCAPHGLDDLLGMTWRLSPVRVSAAISRKRLNQAVARFPALTVAPSSDRAALEEFLHERGAGGIPHPGGTLLAHLGRVADLLADWGAGESLQAAGLCHAAYGTDGFARALMPPQDRDQLCMLLGPLAEDIVYRYGSAVRAEVYPLLDGDAPVPFLDRFTGQRVSAGELAIRAFAELTAANELDVLRHNPEFAGRWGDELRALMHRMRGYLTPAALTAWV